MLEKSIELFEKSGNRHRTSTCYHSKILCNRVIDDKAIHYYIEALKIHTELKKRLSYCFF